MAFDSTISGTSANSYISVSEADDYFTLRYENALWTALATAVKESILVTATRRLDVELYSGYKTLQAQTLQFTRAVIYDSDGLSLSSTAIPINMINAICEMVYFILTSDERLMSDDLLHDAENLSSFSGTIDGMSVSYAIRADAKANKLPQEVIVELTAIGNGVWKKSRKVTLIKR